MTLINKIIVLIFVLLLAVAGYLAYDMIFAPVYEDALDPIDYSSDPEQVDLDGHALPAITRGNYTFNLALKAQYRIAGVLVGAKRYHGGGADYLSPYDYAIVWGRAPAMIEHVKFKQMVRFSLYNFKSGAPIDHDYLSTHHSNNHLIPANKNIRRALKRARKGDEVILEGYLTWVTIRHKKKGMNVWRSSLKRTDKGNGACEIIYLTSLRINDRIYR